MNQCPFCFGFNLAVRCKTGKGEGGVATRRAFVQCMTCHARGSVVRSETQPEAQLKELAVKRWNR